MLNVRDMCAHLGIAAIQLASGEWTYPWAHPKARFCFFLYADILGFSNALSGDIVRAATMIRSVQKIAQKLSAARPVAGGKTAKFGYQLAIDTVIFYLQNVRDVKIAQAYDEFLEKCGILYWTALSKHDIMLRGAISAARDFIVGSEMFVAPTLPLCYDIEKMQDWAGIGIDTHNITLAAGPMGLTDHIIIPSYTIPIKGSPIGVGYILNPTMPRVTRASGRGLSVSKVIDKLRVNIEKDGLPDGAKVKIQNTIKYLEWGQLMQTVGW